ncbi:MAG: hypothetical protein QOH90_1309 [Actinomycetota bacterium]|jgi:transcriptional regulator with GAF, ATPase, and Fis domain|nr:hypothetical protein [Actinomycetota bacterium]
MSERASGQAGRPINSLADLNLSAETLDSILGHIGRLGVEALEGWAAAAASLVERDKVATYGATEERLETIDQAQYDAKKGPCVDALGGDVQYFNADDIPPRWRQFGEAATNEGIYSVVSFPLQLDGEVMGALNFYSEERDALRTGQKEEGLLFASQAAVAVANAKALHARTAQVENLEEGLQTRTIIGQATGLLMAQEGLTSEEAFQKMVKVSQTSNIKLREIAQRYVEVWEEKAGEGKVTAE